MNKCLGCISRCGGVVSPLCLVPQCCAYRMWLSASSGGRCLGSLSSPERLLGLDLMALARQPQLYAQHWGMSSCWPLRHGDSGQGRTGHKRA